MKKNLATLVFNGIDHKEFVNVVTNFLTDTELEMLAYHFSGDSELYFEMPEFVTEEAVSDKIASYFKNGHNFTYKSLSNLRMRLNLHDQLVEVRADVTIDGYYKEGETRPSRYNTVKKEDGVLMEATFEFSNNFDVNCFK